MPRQPLHLEEDILLVQEPEEEPADSDVAEGSGHAAPAVGKERDEAAEDEPLRVLEVDQALSEIDGDRVHADHGEEERPPDAALHIDDPVEEREKKRRVAGDGHREGRRPERLVDRTPVGADESDRREDEAAERHRSGVLRARALSAADEVADEHAEHRGQDRARNSGEALGVEVRTVGVSAGERPVEPAAEIPFGGEDVAAGRHAGRGQEIERDEREEEKSDGEKRARLPAPDQEIDPRGEHPPEADAAEDAPDAEAREVELQEKPVVDEAEGEEDESAHETLARHPSGRKSPLAALGERERKARAGEEKEGRKDGVHELEPVPRDVSERRLELVIAERRGHGAQQPLADHDEQHVESAHRIKRGQTLHGHLLSFSSAVRQQKLAETGEIVVRESAVPEIRLRLLPCVRPGIGIDGLVDLIEEGLMAEPDSRIGEAGAFPVAVQLLVVDAQERLEEEGQRAGSAASARKTESPSARRTSTANRGARSPSDGVHFQERSVGVGALASSRRMARSPASANFFTRSASGS